MPGLDKIIHGLDGNVNEILSKSRRRYEIATERKFLFEMVFQVITSPFSPPSQGGDGGEVKYQDPSDFSFARRGLRGGYNLTFFPVCSQTMC